MSDTLPKFVSVVLERRYAAVTPVPFGVERLMRILFLRLSVAVVAVALVVWNKADDPKLVPAEVALRYTVLYDTATVEVPVDEVILIPITGFVALAAVARMFPTRLLYTETVVPDAIVMPIAEPEALVFSRSVTLLR